MLAKFGVNLTFEAFPGGPGPYEKDSLHESFQLSPYQPSFLKKSPENASYRGMGQGLIRRFRG
jgi:hypothetical protein